MEAVKTENLTKIYKDKKAVDNLCLNIPEGTLYGLLGVNGAGKSTTVKMLSCLILPTCGSAEINGCNLGQENEKIKAAINVSPQETAVAENLTVRENLEFIAGIYGSKKEQAKKLASESIKRFELEEIEKMQAKKLSGGYKRRLSIAMSLISKPSVLFLDEPTLGLDVLARRELWTLIKSLKGKVTIILTTHYLEEAQALCDTIGIMSNGKLIIEGTVDDIIKESGCSNFEDAFVSIAEGENIK